MNIVEVYVETVKGSGKYELLEGFDDESINMKIIAKDYNDLSKVFTPFSQSFTVPAQGKNGRLLNFFLDTDVRKGNTSRLFNAKIYVNKELYKTGQVSIVSGKRKFGLLENYVLNFSTGIPNLKELIGDMTISGLPDFGLTFLWNNSNIYQHLTNPPVSGIIDSLPDVYVPMVSNKRVWTYNDSSDISSFTNNIKWIASTIPTKGEPKAILSSELRPAIRMRSIFSSLKQFLSYKGVEIDCPLYSSSRFNGIYVHCNKEDYETDWITLDIISGINVLGTVFNFGFAVDTVNDKLTISTTSTNPSNFTYLNVNLANLFGIINDYDLSDIKAEVRLVDMRPGKEGTVLETVQCKDYTNNSVKEKLSSFKIFSNSYGLTDTAPLVFKIEVKFDKLCFFQTSDIILGSLGSTTGIINNLSNDAPYKTLNLQKLLPDIKVIDWLTSFFKMFNIRVIENKESNTLLWLTPDDITRKEKDFTKYVQIDEDDVKVQKLFKVYNFTHKMPKYFSNVNYKKANESSNTNSKEYGQLLFTATERFYDGEYKIDTVFSIVPPTNIGSTVVQTHYAFKDTSSTDEVYTRLYDQNFDEFTIFYCNGVRTLEKTQAGVTSPISFAFREGTVNSKVDTYVKSNIVDTDNVSTYTTSLGFQAEVNILPKQFVCLKNQFSNYYLDQITLLNNPNILGYEFTAYLPPQEVKDLDVRDKLVIGEKSYLIQSADVDLTTGKTKLILNNTPIVLINTPPDAITSMWTINNYNSPNLFFTRNYGSDTAVTVQTSTDGINWVNNTGSVTSPRNIRVIPTGTLIRLQSVSDLSTSNIITV